MIREIPFIKYSSCGNAFIIIDEIQQPWVSEPEKAGFAARAANIFFGLGSDGVIFIQPSHRGIFRDIQAAFSYWTEIPVLPDAGFILRLFEPDGSESFSCGNGLLSLAHYLFQRHGIRQADIITEIPTARPRRVSIGTDLKTGAN